MTQHPTYDAVIIGGGLVGAAAALALKQQGRQIALVEPRLPESDFNKLESGWDARVYAISPANRQFLQKLEAWPPEKRVQAVKKMDVYGDQGGRIEFNAETIRSDRLTSIIENRWLLAALWQRIKALDIRIINEKAAALKTDVNEAQITLSNGETVKTKLIIGADGAESWVRFQTGIAVREEAYGHHGVVANFQTEYDHQNTAFQWFRNGEVLAYLPLPERRISIVWSTADPEKLTETAPDVMAKAVSEQGCGILGKLTPCSPVFSFNLVLRRPETTAAQRVILMGDAAHTIHPLAGQGVNLGFGDVIEWTRLTGRATDIGAHPLLKQYAQNRIEPVRTMQMACDGLFKLFGNKTAPGLPMLRNSGLDWVNNTPWLKNRLIRHAMGL